jgi:two-component system phosphate regulon sensor histidine kinase PhoR
MAVLKNPTPRQISFFSSLVISVVLSFILLGLRLTEVLVIPYLSILAIFLITLMVGYFVAIYYLKRYIYRKIKLIYKTIHKHKLNPLEKSNVVDIDVNIMDQVEREVEEWTQYREKEIQDLKSYAEYRRKFLGDISHELKTPIFNIQGYIDSLLDGAKDEPERCQNYLERAARNVERLNTIVEDLEAIARLESGELMLDLQTFDIRDLTDEVFDDLEIKASEKNIKLEFKEGAAHHYKVRGDRETIRQVLMNLILNSIKYGKTDGHTKVGFYDMDKNILIEVADSGIGIDKKHLNHVFDRFYRVDKSRSREQGGSGLGLAIVKHIIEAHKQTINVRSTVGLGSTFGFTLEKV